MTKQEIFNRVVEGLASQGFERSMRSNDPEDICMYRGLEGRKCAAGHLIRDEYYNEGLECRTSNDSAVQSALAKSGVPMEYTMFGGLVWKLQKCHDRPQHPDDVKLALRVFAEEEGLEIPEVLK